MKFHIFVISKKSEAIIVFHAYRKTNGFDNFSKSWNFLCYFRLKTCLNNSFLMKLWIFFILIINMWLFLIFKIMKSQKTFIYIKTSNFDDFSTSRNFMCLFILKKNVSIIDFRIYMKTSGFDDFSKSWNFMCSIS